MARYIDADAFEVVSLKDVSDEFAEGVMFVLEQLDKAPTIKARPVVRGEWVLNKDGSGTCNQCGRTQKSVWDHDGWQNFCGHCGAEMQQGYER